MSAQVPDMPANARALVPGRGLSLDLSQPGQARFDAEPVGQVSVLRYLNATETNGADALEAAIDAAADLMASGRFARVAVNGAGLMLGLDRTVTVPAGAEYLTLKNFGLYPRVSGSVWIEDDTRMSAMFDEVQTVTSEGKTWSLRRPLLCIEDDTKGVELERFRISGIGSFSTRQAAGVRVIGASALRKASVGYIENVESYGFAIGDTVAPNNGAIDLDSIEIKPNGRADRMDRTSYGLVVSGNDMEVTRCAVWYAHCPVLVTKYGATSRFISHDFYNGASFDNTGFPHRVMEYWGNSNVFNGGRFGNGMIHMFAQDAVITTPKFGFTGGTVALPPSMFRFYASKPSDDLRSFALALEAEVPIELKSLIPWFSFEPATAPNSWGIDTAALANIKGYAQVSASGRVSVIQGSASEKGSTNRTAVDGSFAYYEDRTTTQKAGIGVTGDALRLVAGDTEHLEMVANGNLRPLVDAVQNLGSTSRRFANVVTVLVTLGDGLTISTGTGSPEGVVDASKGSLYLRAGSGSGSRLWVKESDAAPTTGWVGK